MPAPLAAAGIVAGAQVLGTGATAYAQGRMNRKTRAWNEKMYQRQREDSLKDWAMVNAYNSPEATMQRYREAGLSPHLIYGQANDAPAVRSSDTPSWNPKSPEYNLDMAPALGQYANIQLQSAQIDNLRTQQTVATQEALLKAQQTANMSIKNATDDFSLMQAKRLADTSLQAAQANVQKTLADTESVYQSMSISQQENARRAAQNTQSLQMGLKQMVGLDLDNANKRLQALQTKEQTTAIKAQVDKTNQEIANLQNSLQAIDKDNTLRDLDIKLKKSGIQPGDHILIRMLIQQYERMMKSPQSSKPRAYQQWSMPPR